METPKSKSNNKTVLWIAGGCVAILICMLAVFLFGFGGLYWLGSQTAEEVTVKLDISTEMEVGKNVEFRIMVTNISTVPVQLIGIDFSVNYLRGILIETTDPLYTDTYQYPALGGELFQTYSFNKPIAPAETLTIVFNGKAVISGDYNGTVTVCINSDVNCRANVVRTIIK